MIIDDLTEENAMLKRQNTELKQKLHRYRRSLWSVLNILEPEQLAIIQHDLIGINQQLTDYAQS